MKNLITSLLLGTTLLTTTSLFAMEDDREAELEMLPRVVLLNAKNILHVPDVKAFACTSKQNLRLVDEQIFPTLRNAKTIIQNMLRCSDDFYTTWTLQELEARSNECNALFTDPNQHYYMSMPVFKCMLQRGGSDLVNDMHGKWSFTVNNQEYVLEEQQLFSFNFFLDSNTMSPHEMIKQFPTLLRQPPANHPQIKRLCDEDSFLFVADPESKSFKALCHVFTPSDPQLPISLKSRYILEDDSAGLKIKTLTIEEVLSFFTKLGIAGQSEDYPFIVYKKTE